MMTENCEFIIINVKLLLLLKTYFRKFYYFRKLLENHLKLFKKY